jgi:hypothetical protein
MKKHFTMTATNAVDDPAPTSVWGYKGAPGKGGKTRNSDIIREEHKNEKENDQS